MITRNRFVKVLMRQILVTLLVAICGSSALAHKPSDSYLRISGGGQQLTAEWDIALKDLEFVIGLDADQDGQITWGELKSQQASVTAHALSRLKLTADGQPCKLEMTEMMVTRHSDGAYVVLSINTDAPGDIEHLNIHYDLLFDVDPTHRGLVLYDNGSVTSTHVLSPDEPIAEICTADAGLFRTLVEYVREGVWHIWIGFDHILFLISLLLPAVFIRKEKSWLPVEAFRPALRAVLKIVTVFTIAHSITLWLAVMEYVKLPSQMVEATIAFSIIVTALNNLFPVLKLPGWTIAFSFGLIHGFGFANVLIDLGLSNVALAISLLGFNIGVELGQLAIVLGLLPISYLTRNTHSYRNIVFRAGSFLIAVVATVWMYERIFNLEILGF